MDDRTMLELAAKAAVDECGCEICLGDVISTFFESFPESYLKELQK